MRENRRKSAFAKMRDDVQQHNDDSGYLSEGIITPQKKHAPLVRLLVLQVVNRRDIKVLN